MSLKTSVKVGNISNLSDARYCAGMGVDFLGFCLDHFDSNYMDPDNLKIIQEWVVGPMIVGEFSSTQPDYIRGNIIKYSLDMIEISSPIILEEISEINIPKILKFDISKFEDIGKLEKALKASCEMATFFIIEKSGNSNIFFSDLDQLATNYKIFLGFDIEAENVRKWLSSSNIGGISMRGSTEVKPGFKDYDDLADILEILEKED